MSQLGQFLAMTVLPVLDSLHGEDVEHWPKNVKANAVTIRATIDRSNQTAEGSQVDVGGNRKVEAYLTVSIAKTVPITFNEVGTDVSVLIIDGQAWYCQKLLGEDSTADGQRIYQFKRTSGIATRQAGR